MTLLEKLDPTVQEIMKRYQSLSTFIAKAEKQLPILKQKVSRAKQADIVKITDAVGLISRHINKNIQESSDLQEVANALLQQCADDKTGTAKSAISELNEMISSGTVVQQGLRELQELISEIERLIEQESGTNDGKREQKPESTEEPYSNADIEPNVEQSVTVMNPAPPQPVPKTPVSIPKTSIESPEELQVIINNLKTELNDTKSQLLEEMSFNKKQAELIEQIQGEISAAQQEFENKVTSLKSENEALKEQLNQPVSCQECEELRYQLNEVTDEFNLLKQDYISLEAENEALEKQSEEEILELQREFTEMKQSLENEKVLKTRQLTLVESPKNMKTGIIDRELQQKFNAIQQRTKSENDELSDPEDAQVVCEQNEEMQAMISERNEMRQMIAQLTGVLSEMNANLSNSGDKYGRNSGRW